MNYARKYLCSRIWKAVKVQIVQLGIPLNYLVLASSKRIILMHIDLLCHWILPFLKLCCLIEVLNDDERWRLRNIWMQCVSSDLSIIKLATANNWGPSLLELFLSVKPLAATIPRTVVWWILTNFQLHSGLRLGLIHEYWCSLNFVFGSKYLLQWHLKPFISWNTESRLGQGASWLGPAASRMRWGWISAVLGWDLTGSGWVRVGLGWVRPGRARLSGQAIVEDNFRKDRSTRLRISRRQQPPPPKPI